MCKVNVREQKTLEDLLTSFEFDMPYGAAAMIDAALLFG
jgi:hypothetical protein